jgi:hypothetical protein
MATQSLSPAPDDISGPSAGTVGVSIRRHGTVIELGLSGELDVVTAPRLQEAIASLRCCGGPPATIVIDTSRVARVTEDGYHALQAVLVRPDGLWDPRIALIVGSALARREAAMVAGSAPRASRRARLTGG